MSRLLTNNLITGLYSAASKFLAKIADGKKKDKDFGIALEDAFTKSKSTLFEEGRALAQRTLKLHDEEVKFKNNSARTIVCKWFDTAVAFLNNKDKVSISQARKEKITTGIFDIAHGFTSVGNPLLDYGEYPPYSQIKPEHALPAVQEAVRRGEAELEKLFSLCDPSKPDAAKNLTFNNTLKELQEIERRFNLVVEPFIQLCYANATRDLSKAYDQILPLKIEFEEKLRNDLKIYDLLLRYSRTPQAKSLTGERRRHLQQRLKDFKYNGAGLKGPQKARYIKITQKLAQLIEKFRNNLIQSRADIVITDPARLKGLPKREIHNLKKHTDLMRKKLIAKIQEVKNLPQEQATKLAFATIPSGAYLISKDDSILSVVMDYADDANLRRELGHLASYEGTKSANRGIFENLDGNTSLDNTPIINQILRLRREQARLVGCPDYATLQLKYRMVKKPQYVTKFLMDLIKVTQRRAEQDHQDLIDFQKRIGYKNLINDPNVVCSWDRGYLIEKLRKEKFGLDTNKLSEYFEFNNLLNSMLNLATKLYGITFVLNPQIDKWDKDMLVYEVYETKSKGKLGTMYIDPFNRPPYKDLGAYAVSLVRPSKNINGEVNLPQIALACNFPRPTDTTPSLLNPTNHVLTLFHEFGHGLHFLLSENELSSQAGSKVSWDFVEVPSQFHENFVWQKSFLKQVARHYQTGEPLLNEIIDKIIQSRGFNIGLSATSSTVKALFDMEAHQYPDLRDPNKLYRELWNKFHPFKYTDNKEMPANSFTHPFTHEYAAGVYGYAWSAALEADLFREFDKAKSKSRAGRRFRKEILAPGDTKDQAEMVRNFLGRRSSKTAFFNRVGLK